MIGLSTLISVYNEVETIAEVLEKVNKVLISKRVIIVDDYSNYGTRGYLRKKLSFSNGNNSLY
ncbi:MAG: glycosyltransferase [Candidatus Omnitrophica bacterium]|nr:glycosyltransferase [Candidatus Omnitrophota bacterium]